MSNCGTWKYRCSKCRGRNVFERKLDGWMAPACKHCGHDKFYLDRARQFRRDYCDCSHTDGYHYRHREGSPFCIHNPEFQVNARTRKHDEKLEDVLEDIALREQCPF